MLTTVASYSLPYEAQIAWARLDSEGIPAYIADEQTINMQWLYSNALGGVRVQVPGAYAERAVEILSEDLSDTLAEQESLDSAYCSKCGSSETEPHQLGRRIAFLVFLGLDFPFFPVKNTTKCKVCGHINEP